MSEPLSTENQAATDAVAKASYDTLHTGRFMIGVNLTNYAKELITILLDELPPDIAERCREEKRNKPNSTHVIVLVDDPNGDKCKMSWLALEPTIVLEPEVAGVMLKNLSNATPLKTVPFPASPQLDWLANWATSEAHRAMTPDLNGDKYNLPVSAVNILHGLFCKTNIVVILAFLQSRDPQRIAFSSVSEATLTPDGKIVPTFSM